MIKKERVRVFAADDYLLTAMETASILSISRSALYVLVQNGDITAVHIGRMIRFRAQDIQAYIDSLAAPADDTDSSEPSRPPRRT